MWKLESSALQAFRLIGMDEPCSARFVEKALGGFYSGCLFFRRVGGLHLFQSGAKPSELPVVSFVFNSVGAMTLE